MTEHIEKKKAGFSSFSKNYWVVIVMEFFERGSYYGMMSILSVYMTDQLNFTKESVGVIKGTIQPLLYILPILAGALGDRFGYRKTLTFAFIFLGLGYFLTSQATEYAFVFASLVIMGIGAGSFKPMISGAIASAAMLIPTFFIYKEPKKPENTKTLPEVFKGMVMVLTDVKFIGLIVIYSGFWILYFQMFDSVLWYVQKYVDASSLNSAVNGFLVTFGINMSWKFDVEHVTVINAGTIILLQIIVSNIVKHTKALPTMIVGITMGTLGMAVLAISTDIWVFIIGIVVFSIGEMTAHPKFISYVGLIAPEDKKALYLGYAFLYGVLGSFIGGILGANLYVHFVDKLNQPSTLWIIFSMIGVVTIIGLLLYNKFLHVEKV